MTVTRTQVRPVEAVGEQRRWVWAQYLAVVGAIGVVWGTWSIVAWLLDGPSSITRFQDRDSANWIAARVYEAFAIAVALGMGWHVIRGCIRARGLTLDGRMVLAGLTIIWLDPLENFVQPVLAYSSNWVNLGSWCGHVPLIVNPDCGRMPWPILFDPLVYAFGLLLFAKIIGAFLRWTQPRWSLNTGQTIALTMAVSVGANIVFELPVVALQLWVFPGSPVAADPFRFLLGAGSRYPVTELIAGSLIIAGYALAIHFKDDRGRTIFDRGLEGLSPTRRAAISTLAISGFLHLFLILGVVMVVATGFYADPYPKLPPYVLNDLCDGPGVTGTAYGPCPGTPGYRAPFRTLPALQTDSEGTGN